MGWQQMVKSAARRSGADVRARSSVPFGVSWVDDLAFFLPEPRVAFDVGANVGQTVASLTSRFEGLHVHCFEPVPSTFRTLVQDWGSRERVWCHELALGASIGTAEMTDEPGSGRNTIVAQGRPTVTVPLRTVDDVAAQQGLDQLDLLKIDVEGYEADVLQGASGLLGAHAVRFVLAECEFTRRPEEPHGDVRQLLDLLLPLGYRVVAFYSGGVDGLGWRWGDVLLMLPQDDRPVACSPYP